MSTAAIRTLAAARVVQAVRDRRRPANPAELGKRIVPGYRITPAVAIISAALADAIDRPDQRVIVTIPPRESKSTTVAVVGTAFALSRNADERIILASYADSLAWEHSRSARALIAEHTDLLGVELSADKTSAGRWTVDGHDGGLLAVGIGSGITGFGAGLLLVDDPHKNAQDADSAASRARVVAEFRSTLLTRVHPGGSVVIIGTRWHEDDLIGQLLHDEPDRWTHINIPAVAEDGIPDVLGRPAGVAMTSALGRTAEQFDDLRRSVGSRSWYALFQGVPSSPEGGLVKREWLEQWRLPAAPQHPVKIVVAVDPADSGERDAAGVVAACLTADGQVAMIADVSAHMTSEQWARAAVDLAVDVGASEIAVEAFSSGTTYVRVVREALSRAQVDRFIRVSGWPPKGSPRRGDAVARSSALLQALEVGTCRLAGQFPEFEDKAVHWQASQHQPDSLAALVIAHDLLAPIAGQLITFAPPVERGENRPPPEWMTRKVGGTDRSLVPGLTGDRKPAGQNSRPQLARSVRGGGYDPMAYTRPTRRTW
ncbi:hypothetical protein [[Mycobacterium] holstebronense]|uniref:Terminase n=1 Tax=[Mycobacterium] holstebronense TaxID=3064288 RepID=A0ABM9LSY5_9MYCO|nr:hypothetical protein [Mycolicibacter sp. MU0102]CAJ1504222.1 hypothetical protein MU0102_002190 [Mycolicibacter sp. MU0102]